MNFSFKIFFFFLYLFKEVTSKFNYNSDFNKWFGAPTSNLCPVYHVQVVGLEPHQCVSYAIVCIGVTKTALKSQNGIQVLCHEKFQISQASFSSSSTNFILSTTPNFTVSIDLTDETQISYNLQQQYSYEDCILGFIWLNQQRIVQAECFFCSFFQYGKNCKTLPAFSTIIPTQDRRLNYIFRQCGGNCNSCTVTNITACIAFDCKNFYFGENCASQCQLSCDQDTCLCNTTTGDFLSCKEGFIEQDTINGKICVQKCETNCNFCALIDIDQYECKSCKYQQTLGAQNFLDQVIVNKQCNGIENCLEYVITKDSSDFESIQCTQCYIGFFISQNQTQCLPCWGTHPYCLFCTKQEPTICLACKRGYYLDSQKICQKAPTACISPCSLCLVHDVRFCTMCIFNTMTPNYLGICVCNDGYYESGNPSEPCLKCHPYCATCSLGTISDCITCNSINNRIFVKGQCNCIDGYGVVSSINPKCYPCHSTCQTCEFYSNRLSCTSCYATQIRELSLNSECACKENYGDANKFYDVCFQCYYTCGYCLGKLSTNCQTCSPNSNRSLTSNNECKCNKNYYESSIQSINCLSCHHSCSDCLLNANEDSCTECPITRIKSSNTSKFKCNCKDVNFFDDGINQECQQCHYSCNSCNGYQNYECLTCDISYRVQTQNLCQCPFHHYDNGILVCSQCHHSCLTCVDDSINSCLTCSLIEEKRYFKESSCICVDGYFDDGISSECLQCSYKCKTCQNTKDICVECADNSIRELGNDFLCQCPSHFFDMINEPKCQKCHFKCLTCSGESETNCLTCDDSFNRVISDSRCKCKQHYFELELENCSICSASCKDCEFEYNNCISCSDDKLLLDNKCICGGKQHGLKISTYKQSGIDFCYQCHYSCYSCNGILEQNCQSCLDSEFRQFQSGKCPCIDGYVDVGQPQCKKCSYNCQNCIIQQTFCTSCQENTQRILNVSAKTCPCQIGYFDDGFNSNCQICNYTCESCQIISSQCLTCPLNSQRIFNDFLYQCNCDKYYYDNGQKNCEKCHYSCFSCNGNSYNNCTQCEQVSLSFRYIKNNQCLCLDGYYDIGTVICDKCSIQCLTCINYSFQCSSCVYSRKQQNNDCICKQGYYDIGYKDCSECDKNCFECVLTSQNCISCNSQLFRVLDQLTSKCVCMKGYVEISNLCEKCNYQCKTCSISQEQCDSCPTNRQLIGNKCYCYEDSFDNGVDCEICSKSCLTCQYQSDFCLTCSDVSHRIFQLNQCICEDGYYDDQVNISCEICNKSCKTCIITSTQCLSCHLDFELEQITQTCQCKKGKYFDDSTQICLQCHVSCEQCKEYPKCTVCISLNRQFNLLTNQCDCQQGYFEENQNDCTKCHYTCQICSISYSNCLSCEFDYNRVLVGNTCECLSGFYDVGIERCQPCSTKCETCFYSSNQCMKCFDYQFRVLNGNDCICKEGYFDSGSAICQKCSNSCQTCTTLKNFCTSCDVIQKRYDYSSIHKCPCIQGFYEDENDFCQKCKPKCSSCAVHAEQCLTCSKVLNSNRFSLSQNCNCKEGYFDDGINVSCQICDSICKTCSDKRENCIECFNNLRDNPPFCSCKDGFFEDVNKVCLQCSNQCQTCIENKSNCQTCKIGRLGKECKCEDGYYEADLEACQPCYFQCQTCQLADHCLICKGDRIDSPFCYCEEGFYDDEQSLNCKACDPTCRTCTISGCLTCNANRILSSELTCDQPEGSISYTTTPWCSNCQVAVVHSQFSDDLSSVIIKFDFPLKVLILNAFQSNLCDALINNSTLKKLGTNYNCQFSQQDQYIFIIQLDYESTLDVGDVIEFKQNILAHNECEKKLETFIFTQVGLPKNPIPPFVQFDIPQYQLSPCVDNQVLYNLSLNDGKRQFIKISWSKILELQTETLEQQDLNLYIPKETLPELRNISFQVTVTNFINISSTFNFYLITQTVSEPSIEVVSTNRQYYVYEKIEIKFIISVFSNCKLPEDEKIESPKFFINLTEINRNNPAAKSSNLNLLEVISEKEYSTVLEEYSLSPLTLYTFEIYIEDQKTKQSKTRNLQIKVAEAKLFCIFVNFSKTQDYRNDLYLQLNCKDLNENQEWNTDAFISITFTCKDLVTSEQCLDKQKKKIQIQANSFNQVVKKLSVDPYTIQLWQVEAKKNNLIFSISQTVVFLEESILPQEIIFSDWYLMRPINSYECLNFTFSIPFDFRQNLSSLSIGFIYDFQVVKILNPKFFENIIQIFDHFNQFQRERKISLYFQAQYTHSIAPRQTSLTFDLNEPPNCGKLFFEKSLKNNGLNLKIGVKCSFSQFLPFKYKLVYFLLKQDQEDFLSGTSDFSLGLQEFQKSNIFEIYIPNPIIGNQIYFLIQVIDKNGGKSKILENFYFEKININCEIITDDISDFNLKISLMFSAYQIFNNSVCQQQATKIYQKLIQEALEQYDYTVLQTVKVYARYKNLVDQQNASLKRTLEEQQSQGCVKIEDNYFYSLNQTNATNQTSEINIVQIESQIKLINKIFQKLNSNKKTFSQTLQENYQQWNQEIYDKYQNTLSLYQSLFYIIDDQLSYFENSTIQNEAIYQLAHNFQQMIDQIIQEILSDILIDDIIYQYNGNLFQIQLQKLNPITLLNQFNLQTSIDDFLIKYYIKEQVSFNFNPLQFSIQEQQKLQSFLNTTNSSFQNSKLFSQKLHLYTEYGNHVILQQISKISIDMKQVEICNDLSDQLTRKFQIECIQININNNFRKCEKKIFQLKQDRNKLQIICECEELGQVFLSFSEILILEQQVEQIESDLFDFNTIKLNFTNSYLLPQVIYFIIIILITLFLSYKDKKNIDHERLDAEESNAGINMKNYIYPGHYKIIVQNYKFLHNILNIFQYQPDTIKRPFIFMQLAIQFNFSIYIGIFTILFFPNNFLPLTILLQVASYLIQKAFIKIVKGIMRINSKFYWISIIFPIIQMIMLRILNILVTKNINEKIYLILSTFGSFIIYEFIFEPIIMITRVHIYTISIPHLRMKSMNKTILMIYYFAWHWRLEQVMKQFQII